MSEITHYEYWKEVEELAEMLVTEQMDYADNDREAAEEAINDHALHETIDGHQWIIYNAYNLDVIKWSDNADYYADNFGGDDLAAVMKEGGLDRVHTVVAFFAMYADVQDKLESAFDDYEAELEEDDE